MTASDNDRVYIDLEDLKEHEQAFLLGIAPHPELWTIDVTPPIHMGDAGKGDHWEASFEDGTDEDYIVSGVVINYGSTKYDKGKLTHVALFYRNFDIRYSTDKRGKLTPELGKALRAQMDSFIEFVKEQDNVEL